MELILKILKFLFNEKKKKEEEEMKKIEINGTYYFYYNVDDNKINYTQRNNEYKWGIDNLNAKVNSSTTCNCTSICMALDYAGFKFPSGKYKQPEDNFAEFIMNSKKIDEEYARRYPAMYKAFKNDERNCYTPNEIHKLLEIGANEWIGTEVDNFSDSTKLEDIINDIVINQLPVVISGSFPQPNGKTYNHIVCLTGLAFKKEYKQGDLPAYYIIDDPWGYTFDYTVGKSGNDIKLTSEQFISWMKPISNSNIKFAHRFKKPVAVV